MKFPVLLNNFRYLGCVEEKKVNDLFSREALGQWKCIWQDHLRQSFLRWCVSDLEKFGLYPSLLSKRHTCNRAGELSHDVAEGIVPPIEELIVLAFLAIPFL